jgi:hypothetical protein
VVQGIASAAKHMSCATLLAGLGIPAVGRKTSLDLERAFDGSFHRLQSASLEQLTAVPGKLLHHLNHHPSISKGDGNLCTLSLGKFSVMGTKLA